ncbi:DUF7409 domain-containing protein [Halanaeroarchaeum sulfurireducens]|uniref:DUF7409 domain-containing protein n=1 Tax=Halanaeroarchaeum sulfurireducens TaxID=1604004 RepID=UPI00118756FF|nr:hypothetical protein [Halanaeroarchaeum sulfurireducens]
MTTRNVSDDLQEVKFVGPATATVLVDADISAQDLMDRRVSHAQLICAGVNPGVAARIRREHSLSWSKQGGEDLDRRAEQVRGLKDGERAWVAASSGSWEAASVDQAASTDGRGDEIDEETRWQSQSWPSHGNDEEVTTEEIAWRERSSPTPVTDVDGVGEREAAHLGEAGITSVRRLATANPGHVADSLDYDLETIREWRDAARSAER